MPTRNMLRILVVDDHPLFRSAVRSMALDAAPEVEVLEAASGCEALALLGGDRPIDLILLDLELPDMRGDEVLAAARAQSRGLPVVILSASEQRDDILLAMDRGAVGYIPKSSSRDVILAAIRLVLSGGVYIPPQALAPSAAPAIARPARAAGTLTERQRDILRLLAEGHPNKRIAQALEITEATVKSHLTEIFRVLQVTNRAQALIAARKLNLG